MFVVLLRFSENKHRASEFMEAHNHWIKQGFEQQVFLMVGSLQPTSGGAVLAHNESRELFEARVNQDPFVKEGIVTAEIIEIEPKKANESLSFLLTK